MNNKNKQTNLAYFAGYIDGDGCFYIGKIRPKGRHFYKFPASIIISSVNINILNKFKHFYGGSVQSSNKIITGHKQIHQYVLKKQASLNAINDIFKYLTERKEEAEITKAFIESKSFEERSRLVSLMRIQKDINNLVSKEHKQILKSIKNTIKYSEEDVAYFAGFIDAECSLGISKYKPKNRPNFVYKIKLTLNNTKYPIFKWIMQRFGGSINFVKKPGKNQLCWTLSGKALSKLLPKIYKYLEFKKPVCKELINFYDTTLQNGGARHTEKFRKHYASIIEIRERIVRNVHKLNLKGTNNT